MSHGGHADAVCGDGFLHHPVERYNPLARNVLHAATLPLGNSSR